MVNNKNRTKFLEFIKTRINAETARNYKEGLKSHSAFRYAIDNSERIKFLKTRIEYFDLPVWNPATIKGVTYNNGICELVHSEIDELVIEYRVNLENEDFEIFSYEIDKNKAFGLKAPNRLLMAVNDCLERQIVLELIYELRQGKVTNPFKNTESIDFFLYIFEHFISKDKAPKTAAEYVFRQMFDENSNDLNYLGLEYSIDGTMLEFGTYYNNFINENELIVDKSNYLLKVVMNECKLKTLDRIGNLDKRKQKFNSLLLEFERNNETVE